ncbi:MAG: AAA family ATPase [Pirellulaceae bacterium]
MTKSDWDSLRNEFERAILDCRQLYQSSARLCIQQCPYLLPGSADSFVELMDDLHQGVLIKIYVTIVQADERWVSEEKQLAQTLFRHLWGEIPQGQLREVARRVFREAEQLNWSALVRPFRQFPPLRDRIAALETLIVRVANLVAKADGAMTTEELAGLRRIQHEIERSLRHRDDADFSGVAATVSIGAFPQQLQQEYAPPDEELTLAEPLDDEPQSGASEERLAEAIGHLDSLVGLPQVKHEIRTLTNYLRLQQQRAAAGLPQTRLNLHLVFGGNPGTGKTTVARIVGEIYGAMGILRIGHLVETDRGGLVAEFAGQTAPKTNKKIDEALDGVLFIDEAYSLVDESGDDPYGRESLQTLLKRMEDDRDRIVVILAGYPEEMDRLLSSNPGLKSRFNTHLTFEDYAPPELGSIFGRLCDQNHYQLPAATRAKLLLGFQWLYAHRDDHFGNGRLVRNAFETAIRRLANRIADIRQLTRTLLTTFQPEDIQLPGVPPSAWPGDLSTLRFRVLCDGCRDATVVPTDFLGKRVKCRRCEHRFVVGWGEPAGELET